MAATRGAAADLSPQGHGMKVPRPRIERPFYSNPFQELP